MIATNGRFGCAEQTTERDELLLQQQAGVCGQQLRNALGRSVRAVRRAERVVHVEVVPARELLRERRIVLLLLRMEAHVLEQDDVARRSPATASRTAGPPPSGSSVTVAPSSSASRRATGPKRQLRIGSFWSSEVRAERHGARRVRGGSRIVGSAALMRESSATAPLSSGTLKSTRTRTFFPDGSTSRIVRLAKPVNSARQQRPAPASSMRRTPRCRRDGRRSPTRCRTRR